MPTTEATTVPTVPVLKYLITKTFRKVRLINCWTGAQKSSGYGRDSWSRGCEFEF